MFLLKIDRYQSCMVEFASQILNYDKVKMIELYGFGAIIDEKYKNQPQIPAGIRSNYVNHCFNLNFKEHPGVFGIESLLKTYTECIPRLEMLGPTCLGPVFRNILKSVKTAYQNSSVPPYYVELILTDGDIHDLKETIDIIVEASKYPVSFIVIGIGNKTNKAIEM